MLVWREVLNSADWAILRADVSDISSLSDAPRRQRSFPVSLSLQVHQKLHQVGPGLEHLGIGGVVALSLDHARKLLGDIDIGVLERAGDDLAQAGFLAKADPHGARAGAFGENV